MRKIEKLATSLSRALQYVATFGPRGALLAIEHYAKFKMRPFPACMSTNIPGWCEISMRPRSSDLATFWEIFVAGEYDVRRAGLLRVLLAHYEALLKSGRRPVIIDAGANIGLATVYFSRFFPEADYVLIEADRANAELAARNTEHIKGRQVVNRALWHETGRVALSRGADSSTIHVKECVSDSDAEVETTTIPQLLGGRLQDVLIVKMDIEGAEREVLSKNNDWLRAYPVLFIEPHDGIFNNAGSLAGVLALPEYQRGRLMAAASTVTLVPESRVPATALEDAGMVESH
jgi:FkbM family methyltransferase